MALALAAAAVAADPVRLDAATLEGALAGATTSGINVYGNPYTVRFLPGGTIEGVAGYGDEYRDSGTWWVEGDALCRRWSEWLDGETACFEAVIEGETIHWTEPGSGRVVTEDYAPPR